jgi:RNA polymerase sigma factor (sigma-70 family)
LLASDKMASQTDNELAGLAAKGDDKAFDCLLQRHRQRIVCICLRMLHNRVESEEAAQDSFVKIYFHLKEFDLSRDFAVWTTSIAINECRDRLRKRVRFNRSFRELDENVIAAEPEHLSNDDNSRIALGQVEKAIEKLPQKLREVIVLKAFGDHSYEEIAGILNVRIGTVMSRLFRARRKLADMIDKGMID